MQVKLAAPGDKLWVNSEEIRMENLELVGHGSTLRLRVCIIVRWWYKMIRPIQPDNPFMPDAEKRWKVIPEWAQREILCNVFCSRCLGSVPIVLEKAEMRRDELILRGKCRHCGKDICRVVEPENE